MSLYNSIRLKQKCAGVISFSGKLIPPTDLSEEINSKPEICLIHGESDEVLPIDNFFQAKEYLENMDFNFESHKINNLGHSIDFFSLRKAREFMKKIIK
jgi:phospholipase/carboxylesterase